MIACHCHTLEAFALMRTYLWMLEGVLSAACAHEGEESELMVLQLQVSLLKCSIS